MPPAYDLINTWIVLPEAREELALPLKGKKTGFTYHHLVTYYAKERLKITSKVCDQVLHDLRRAAEDRWPEIIRSSFLSPAAKEKYDNLVRSRYKRLFG